jgi:hypothetical protein
VSSPSEPLMSESSMSVSNSSAIPYGYKKFKMHLASQNKVYADNHSCLKIDMTNIKHGAGVKK